MVSLVKKCIMCNQEKLRNEDNFYFYPYTTTQGKRSIRVESRCKDCSKKRRKKFYYNNIEQEAASSKKYRKEHQEKYLNTLKNYRNTPEGKARRCELQRMRQYNLRNTDLTSEQKRLIDNIYSQARLMEQRTGKKYHVDHVIPLSKGGKHLPENLQILTAKKNMEKNGKICSLL